MRKLAFILVLCAGYTLQAQGVRIGTGGGSPDPSAGLEVDFTDKGLLLPRLTTTQRNSIANPAVGLVIYNTSNQCVESYFQAGWRSLECNCNSFPNVAIQGSNASAGLNQSISFQPTQTQQGWTYLWQFASGTPASSNLANPSVSWSNAGTYAAVLTVTDANGCSTADTVSVTVLQCGSQNQSQTFNYTGSVQTWTVPAGVCSLTVECWGAQGWSGTNQGGLGGYAKATFPVSSGETVSIYVGQQGPAVPANSYSQNAFNGGGRGYSWNSASEAGSGGGASDVRLGGQTLNHRVVVGGGGGGSTDNSNCTGGHGGGLTGGSAGCTNYGTSTGGTQSAGGTGGQNGSFGLGGDANSGVTVGWVGGGGGGWYGGACGFSHQGGGGGSSYTGGHGSYQTSNTTTTAGQRSGNGQVIISW